MTYLGLHRKKFMVLLLVLFWVVHALQCYQAMSLVSVTQSLAILGLDVQVFKVIESLHMQKIYI